MWFASFFTLARFAGEGRVREHTKDTKLKARLINFPSTLRDLRAFRSESCVFELAPLRLCVFAADIPSSAASPRQHHAGLFLLRRVFD